MASQSFYRDYHQAKAAEQIESGQRQQLAGFIAIGAGVAVSGSGVGALLGAAAISTGVLNVQSGTCDVREGQQLDTRSAAMERMIQAGRSRVLARAPPTQVAGGYLDAEARSRAAVAAVPAPAGNAGVPLPRPASDGQTAAYVRFQNGRSVNVTAYLTPRR